MTASRLRGSTGSRTRPAQRKGRARAKEKANNAKSIELAMVGFGFEARGLAEQHLKDSIGSLALEHELRTREIVDRSLPS